MESVPSLLEAVAALMWPALVFLVLIKFAPAVSAVIESARSRRFTVKVGGQELTMDELREQQSNLIADLQAQVAGLRQEMGQQPATRARAEADTSRLGTLPRVLWVDDQPRNNSYFIEQLRDAGVEVDLALSTADGLRRLQRGDYRVVLSDIGRTEAGKYNGRAGIELIEAIRMNDASTPLALYTSRKGAQLHGAEAQGLGAGLVTASATDLAQFLMQHLPEWRA